MKKHLIVAALLCSAVIAVPFACKTQKNANKLDCTTIESTYTNSIHPIVMNNCMPCHKEGSSKGDFTTYEGLKKVASGGELEDHALIKKDMPPKGPLPEDDRKKIRCWLNNGAQNN